MRITEENESNVDERICPICGESCEKDHETVFVIIPILTYTNYVVFVVSNIEPCYEGENDNVFVDLFDELGFLESP